MMRKRGRLSSDTDDGIGMARSAAGPPAEAMFLAQAAQVLALFTAVPPPVDEIRASTEQRSALHDIDRVPDVRPGPAGNLAYGRPRGRGRAPGE